MEKADILEMAVNHLKNLKKRQAHTGGYLRVSMLQTL